MFHKSSVLQDLLPSGRTNNLEPHKLDLMAENSNLKLRLTRTEKDLIDAEDKLASAQVIIITIITDYDDDDDVGNDDTLMNIIAGLFNGLAKQPLWYRLAIYFLFFIFPCFLSKNSLRNAKKSGKTNSLI